MHSKQTEAINNISIRLFIVPQRFSINIKKKTDKKISIICNLTDEEKYCDLSFRSMIFPMTLIGLVIKDPWSMPIKKIMLRAIEKRPKSCWELNRATNRLAKNVLAEIDA